MINQIAEQTDLVEEPIICDAVRDVSHALGEEAYDEVTHIMDDMHAADKAELITLLTAEKRDLLLDGLCDGGICESFDSEILPYLESDVAGQVIQKLGLKQSAEALRELDSDDALHVIEELTLPDQESLIEAMPKQLRGEIEEGLTHAEESAGRLMRRELVSVPEFWTVGDTIDHMRNQASLPETFYILYAVDPRYHVTGRVMLAHLMRHRRDMKISEIMERELYSVTTDMDQEEVAYTFRKYGLVETPVINYQGRLVGTITVDDVVDVIQEEEEEDFLRAGGLSTQDLNSSISTTLKQRFPWLFVNLGTAVLASIVIGAYSETIEQLVALAVLMPIVASMGGNAGTQSVTVAVRALATKELRSNNALRAIRKELFIGILNGLAFASIASAATYAWFGDPMLALVFAGATIFTLMLAGLFGAMIPILLERFKLDPAIASGIFLTTVTDVAGFFSFLGLAAIILL